MQSLKVDFPYISKFQFEDVARTTGGRMSDVVLTKARREYNDYYTGEVELNEYFNNFVHNYTLAYQGPNTAKAQIGVKVKKSQASGMKPIIPKALIKWSSTHGGQIHLISA